MKYLLMIILNWVGVFAYQGNLSKDWFKYEGIILLSEKQLSTYDTATMIGLGITIIIGYFWLLRTELLKKKLKEK